MSRCNCPSPSDLMYPHQVCGTKPPCPVHDTPERLAMLKDIIIPAAPLGDITLQTFTAKGNG